MNRNSSKEKGEPLAAGQPARVAAGLFTLLAAAVFFVFFFAHPVDWIQPETLRLRYYGLQAGLRDGPLTSSFNRYDLEKPLVWEAQGGMFDGRYPIMLFDALLPKFYQPFYSLWAPSLREPVNLLLTILTWLFLYLLIREWFQSPASALVAASFWLITSQTLLDAHHPIRPNMALLTFLLVYIFWELIRLRRLPGGRFCLVRVGIALTAASFTHEFGLNFVPLVVILLWLERRRLKGRIIPVLAVGIISWAIYLLSLFIILPPLAGRVVGYPPPMDWMTGGLEPLLAEPAVIFIRVRDFALVGFREMAAQNLGAGVKLPLLFRLSGLMAAVLILLLGGRKSWRAVLLPLLPAVLYFLAVALLMFPVIPATVEMPVYYYATIVVLFIPPLGAFLSGLPARRWLLAGAALLLIGVMNCLQSSRVLERMPDDFGANRQARTYTRDILSLPSLRRAGDYFAVPVYPAYPRPRVFDISRRWDIMLRVWHGEAEQVFSMLMPVLNLRLYERGYLIGDPEEFAALQPGDPGEYENRAGIYWDMPTQSFTDLSRLRSRAVPPVRDTGSWRRADRPDVPGAVVRPETGPGLLGPAPRALLPPGRWKLEPALPADFSPEDLVMIFALRTDLVPPGPDDVMERVIPIPLRTCRVLVRDGEGGEIFSGEQTYGWSFQLFRVTLSATESWELEVESEGEFEVLGPVFVEAFRGLGHKIRGF